MNSHGASDLQRKLQAQMKRQGALMNQEMIQKSSLAEYVDNTKLEQKTTDYRGKPLLETLPLKDRAKFSRSQWPQENRPVTPNLLPASRNTRTIWRRYPNGELDVSWAYGKLSEAINKYALQIPLSEVDALAISSIYPEKEFTNLPKSIVDIKATISQAERETVQKMVSSRLYQDLFGKDNTKA